ncbi:HAMP domain-containing sensor histidine kinase [Pleionea sp. CnH1-48]|uniref:HAMP domain-containing sensor histidine kinase n=1 Tax=Pleionea sp. CnH1-48 TaxID=2954494 RepID=UPI0020982D97|nr:HAMP domain-containing sensor histidine kinase [Pleionea sp. CnH1-48]MCO7225976.1 HAMP domain-containing histidine kinase [Pleionea sp. CnH1-48]
MKVALRITLIFLVTLITVMVVSVVVIKNQVIGSQRHQELLQFLAHYTQVIADDKESYQELLNKFGSIKGIRLLCIEGNEAYACGERDKSVLSSLHFTKIENTRSAYARNRNDIYFSVSRGEHNVYFELNVKPSVQPAVILGYLCFLVVMIGSCYFLVMRTLNPLKGLHRGSVALGEGNLDYRFNERSVGEFGKLGKTMNWMVQQFNELLVARLNVLLAVSHDLRGPISRIRVAAEMVEQDGMRKALVKDVRLLDELLSQMIDKERQKVLSKDLRFKPSDISSLIQQVIESEFFDQKSKILLEVQSIEPADWIVQLDEEQIQVVVRNLLENAIRHSNDKPVVIRLNKESEWVKVAIIDEGQGIHQADASKIFEAYYQGSQEDVGTSGHSGMGLFLCHSIIKAHNGDIAVISEKGKGAHITVKLPVNRR